MASTSRKSAAKATVKTQVGAPAAPARTAPPEATSQAAAPASDAKPVPTRHAKTAPASPARKAAATAKLASAAKAVKPVKPVKKAKLVRDSFTIPKPEYLVLEQLKQRATQLGAPIKKSELLRAGIKALAAMDSVDYLAALAAVPAIKTGRPAKS